MSGKRESGNRHTSAVPGPAQKITGAAARISKIGKSIDALVDDPSGRIASLRQIAAELNDLQAAIPQFREQLESAEQASRESLLRLESDLRERCSELGWQLDGHWPSFWIERGISVVIDDVQATASIAQAKVAASVEVVVKTLTPLIQELIPAKYSPHEFCSRLAAAYDQARAGSRQVPILDLYRHYVVGLQKPRFWKNAVAKDFVGLSMDQFRAQLSKCLEQGRIQTADGRELRLSPPIEPKDGIFVYQPSERRFGFVGYIEFVGA